MSACGFLSGNNIITCNINKSLGGCDLRFSGFYGTVTQKGQTASTLCINLVLANIFSRATTSYFSKMFFVFCLFCFMLFLSCFLFCFLLGKVFKQWPVEL